MKAFFNLKSLACCAIPLCCNAQNVKTQTPNIILINIDDLGWTDLSCNGSKYYETPNIDKLRESGVWFSQAYAGAANSAPSRACMLTGQYAPRHGIYTVGNPDRGKKQFRKLIAIPNRETLPDGIQILPKTLRDAGYQTFHVGKWHVTENPLLCGVDKNVAGSHAGHPNSYFSPYRNANITDGKEGEFLPDRLGEEAVNLIQHADRSRPFFLYYATYAVHTPLQAEAALIEKYKNKQSTDAHSNPVYAALVEAMDRNVGRVWQAVRDNGLENNTVIIFTSDNGGVYNISKQWPLRAGKGSFYEGGIRVPLIVYQKGVFEKNECSDVAVSQIDLFPTLLDLAGVRSNDLLLDGMSLSKLLKKNKDSKLNKRALFWHFPAYLEGGNNETTDKAFRSRPLSVIRSGDWKLIENFETGMYELYNISRDISEHEELSKQYPEILLKLSKQLNKWKKETNAPIPQALNHDYKKQF